MINRPSTIATLSGDHLTGIELQHEPPPGRGGGESREMSHATSQLALFRRRIAGPADDPETIERALRGGLGERGRTKVTSSMSSVMTPPAPIEIMTPKSGSRNADSSSSTPSGSIFCT